MTLSVSPHCTHSAVHIWPSESLLDRRQTVETTPPQPLIIMGAPTHNRPTAGTPLDVPGAAVALSPLRKPKVAPDKYSLETSSTAAKALSTLETGASAPAAEALVRPHSAAEALSPLKSGAEALATPRGDGAPPPSYNDVVKGSEALAIVNYPLDKKPGAKPDPDSAKWDETMSEATSFLETLKAKLTGSARGEGVWNDFLKIMDDFKEGNCRPREVSRKVTLLFHVNKHKDLVEEMYKWTPWQHRFYMPFTGSTRS